MKDYQPGVTANPFHPNCRSTTCPYFDEDFGEVGERAARGEDGKTYYVPADMNYKKWKEEFVDGGNKSGFVSKEEREEQERKDKGRKMVDDFWEATSGNVRGTVGKNNVDKSGESGIIKKENNGNYGGIFSVENNSWGVDNLEESDIINSGAVSGAKKTAGWQDRHAEKMYEEIRHRTTDVKRISEYTQFSEHAVEEIKQHMFFTEHKFADGTVHRFDSDFDQVQAWDRLSQGKGTAVDIEMLKHEYVELTQMRIHGYVYEKAHEIANKYHNWWALAEKEK